MGRKFAFIIIRGGLTFLVTAAALTVCCVATKLPESKLLGSLKHYEVSQPTGIERLGNEQRFPRSLRFSVRAYGQDFNVALERHDTLFHADYKEFVWNAEADIDGSHLTEVGSHPGEDHCYYHGRVLNPDAAPGGRSIVAISICDGIKGQILTASHDLILEPAHIHIPGHAAVDAIDPDADKLSTEVMVFRRTDHAEPPQLQSLKDFLTPGENSSLVNGDTLAGASHGDLQALLGRAKEGGGDGGRRRLTMRKTGPSPAPGG